MKINLRIVTDKSQLPSGMTTRLSDYHHYVVEAGKFSLVNAMDKQFSAWIILELESSVIIGSETKLFQALWAARDEKWQVSVSPDAARTLPEGENQFIYGFIALSKWLIHAAKDGLAMERAQSEALAEFGGAVKWYLGFDYYNN